MTNVGKHELTTLRTRGRPSAARLCKMKTTTLVCCFDIYWSETCSIDWVRLTAVVLLFVCQRQGLEVHVYCCQQWSRNKGVHETSWKVFFAGFRNNFQVLFYCLKEKSTADETQIFIGIEQFCSVSSSPFHISYLERKAAGAFNPILSHLWKVYSWG